MSDTDTNRALGIGEVAEAYGVTVPTVRSWDRLGLIKSFRTERGQRRFRPSENPALAALLDVGRTSSTEETTS